MLVKRSLGVPTAALLLLLFAAPLLAGPQIESWHTSNGAKVLFVAAPELPMLDLRVVFDAGSARDDPQFAGVAKITNALLTSGAGSWDADQIAERFAAVGASISSGSLRDMAWLALRTLTSEEALEQSLEGFTTLLGAPTFPPAEIARNRQLLEATLRQEAQRPAATARKRFLRALYGDHPYASHDSGDEASLARIDREAIVRHYQRYYSAENAVVAMVGQLDREQAEQIAERVTAGLPQGEAAPPLPEVTFPETARFIPIAYPSTQTHLYIGQPGLYRGDPDYFSLYVGNHILGGSGLVSRLSEEVREQRGLSYSVASAFSPMRRHGPFLLVAQTQNERAEEAREVMLETLRTFIAQGPSAEELEAAQRNITGGFPIRLAGNRNIVEYLAMIGFYALPLDYLETFTAQVEAVTRDSIREAFQRRLDPERLLLVQLGRSVEAQPEAPVEAPVEAQQ